MIEGLLALADYERGRGNAKVAEALYREALDIACLSGQANLLPTPRSRLIDLHRSQKRMKEADAVASAP